MSRNWSALVLLATAMALSWFDSTASLFSRARLADTSGRELRRTGPPPPPGAWLEVGDLHLTRAEVQAFLTVPEVQESAWAEPYRIAQQRAESDLRRAARLVAAVHLLARQAERRASLVAQVEAELARLEREWLDERMQEEIVHSTPPPSSAELEAEYQRLLPSLTLPESRTCRHILFSSRSPDPQRRRVAPRVRAETALQQLREGADFQTLARQLSDSESAPHGGLLAPIRPEDVREEFAEALWKLDPGEISPPVRVDNDYHLIYLVAVHATEVTPLEAVGETIARRLHAARLEEARRAALQEAERISNATFQVEGLLPDATPGALVYRVGARQVTAADYRAWMEGLPADAREYYGDLQNRERHFRDEYRQGLRVELARSRGLDQAPEFLLRRAVNRNLRLAEGFLDPQLRQRVADMAVPEETLRAYFLEHRGRYIAPLEVALDQIHVTWPRSGGSGESEESRIEAAAQRAVELAEQLAGGAARRTLPAVPHVSWYSMRAPQPFGSLPDRVRELLSEDVQYSSVQVLDAAPGTVYGPLREEDHFLLVQLTEIRPARALDYHECRAQVEADYRDSRREELVYDELEDQLAQAGFRFLAPPA